MEAQEIARRIKVAADAVERAAIPDAFRHVAFERALDAVGLFERQAPTDDAHRESSKTDVRAAGDGPLATVANRLSAPLDVVEQIYEDDPETGLRLIVKRTMLPEPHQKAASMRHIALLIAVGRQAAGIEEYTPAALIREECSELKVLDASNFATEVGKLEMRRRGPRNKQELKANRHHFEEAVALIFRITGGESS